MATPITLKIFRGNELVRTEQFSREIIKIGRLSSAHLVLDDERVSRIHSVIEVAPDGAISIIDMGSAEGTFVNGRKVSRGAIKAGDQITLGGMRLVLEGGEAPPAPEPVAPAPVVNRAVAVPAPAPAPAPRPNGSARNGHSTAAAVRAAPVTRPAQAAVAAPLPVAAPAPAPAQPAPAAAPAAKPAKAAPRRAPRPRRFALQPADRTVEDLSHASDVGVELRLLWGDTLLQAQTFVRPGASVLVGKGPQCAIQVEGLRQGHVPVLRFQGGDYLFAFGKNTTGVVEDKGARTAFDELIRSRKAMADAADPNAFWIPVPLAGAVRAELGSHLAIEARPKQPKKLEPAPWWERISYQFLNLFLIFFFLGTAFVIAANNFPYDTDVSADDLFKNPSRMAKFIIKPPEVPKAQPSKDKGLASSEEKSDAGGEPAEKHKGDEGKMGKKDAPKTNGRSAPRAIDPNAKDVVKRSGVLGALGRGGGGLSTVFGQGGLGGDLKGAVGNMFGPVVGDSQGLGGLGIRGSGTGGGGSGETIGIGAPGTKGRGGGLGGPNYGAGQGNLGTKGDRAIKIDNGPPTLLGAIDKELIRKVIQEHAAQIRYCYEQQLAINPRLQGKVAIKWVINGDGSASDAQVEPSATTLDDAKVHECMMARIQSWAFPKPKGGGQAVITYPWILRASGNAE